MAAAHAQPFVYTLTGFKWIGRVPGLAYGYEEAIGYCVDPETVPDKDGISALIRVLTLAAALKAAGLTVADRLDEITVPTLVMWGEQDRLVHRSTAAVWAGGIAGARTVTYPEAGHMPMLELPRRSAADYRAFLTRVRPAEVTARR